jgi:DNA-binding NtrC family response regulator
MATRAAEMGGRQSILVIDDEEVVRVLFQSLLEEEGYDTLLAEDGQKGIELLNRHTPAVALVDKNLPDISGLELIASEKKRHPNTEFIMITGYASLDSAVKAMEVGAFSYLTKPFVDMDVVMDRIRAALDVNNLRLETSELRERLDALSGEVPPKSGVGKSAAAASSPPIERIQHTLSFLESFLDKRDQPPPASAWARTVDMIEEECRQLRRILEELSREQE